MKMIPYGHQHIGADDIREVIKALKSDWITQGPRIREFEDALCRYTGARYAVAVSSGTAALHCACLAAGIKPGDEVITSPITFAASANCVLYCGGKPVFADILPDTANIDPKCVKKKITGRTRALIPVHFGGHPCDMREINMIAARHNLIIIEDAAHALGAEYSGSRIGSCEHSDMAIFSFHPVKSITTGEGGAILTNRNDIYKNLLLFRNHGMEKKGFAAQGLWYYEIQRLGFNYRMTDMQAALGISQLKKLNGFIEKRRKIARFYSANFRDNGYFDIPEERKYALSSFHLYPIRLKDNVKNKKKDIFSSMRNKGLGAQVHYMPVYLHPYYRSLGFKKGICPNAEEFYKREISIPIYPSLTEAQKKFVAYMIFRIFEKL